MAQPTGTWRLGPIKGRVLSFVWLDSLAGKPCYQLSTFSPMKLAPMRRTP